MEYTDRHSRRGKVYIIVGVIVALMVGAVVFMALRFSGVTQEATAETREVVVAMAEIPARTVIEEADLQLRALAADPTNASAFTSFDEVVGRVSSVPISLGQIVSPNLLASTDAGATFSILKPGEEFDLSMPDLRAVSMTVPDDRAVGGTLQPGQPVDLIATMAVNPLEATTAAPAEQDPPEGEPAEAQAPSDQRIPGMSTKTTLQQLDILVRIGSLYILRTDLATAEKITELMATGAQFTFVLRADADDRTAETEGSTLDRLLEEFEFPVPEAADLP